MEPSELTHNAGWMVPALIFAVSALATLVAGLVIWVVNKAISLALQFRKDVMARLDAQDDEVVAVRTILGAIKDLLQDEVHKLRERLWSHDARITRLEEHNGLNGPPPPRRSEED